MADSDIEHRTPLATQRATGISRYLPDVARRQRRPKEKLPPLPFGRWVREVAWRHVFAIAVVAFALFPVVWIISASINPVDSLSSAELIPDGATDLLIENLATLLGVPASEIRDHFADQEFVERFTVGPEITEDVALFILEHIEELVAERGEGAVILYGQS